MQLSGFAGFLYVKGFLFACSGFCFVWHFVGFVWDFLGFGFFLRKQWFRPQK